MALDAGENCDWLSATGSEDAGFMLVLLAATMQGQVSAAHHRCR